jgi:hypothetical protein
MRDLPLLDCAACLVPLTAVTGAQKARADRGLTAWSKPLTPPIFR